MEKKIIPFNVDTKSITEDGEFTGYASIFGVKDSYDDIVEKGAFKKTLAEQKEFSFCDYHDVREVLGLVWPVEDSKGLKVSGKLNMEVQRARERRALMIQRAMKGLSIGFDTLKKEYDDDEVRHLKEIKLYEISLVTFGACPGAEVGETKEELKPYPNEHAARLQSPTKFDKFRRNVGGKLFGTISVPSTIGVIWGHLKNEGADAWAAQSLRFPTKNWTVAEAKAWLKKNKVKTMGFEPASKSLDAIETQVIDLQIEGEITPEHSKRLLTALQVVTEPLLDTQEDPKPSIFSELIGKAETTDKPPVHLFGELIEPKSK
jgi:HK97 family phage prohead protease